MKRKTPACRHEYKNAIQVGNVDYMCPLCHKLLDPMEWFFMNSFTFVDVTPKGKQPPNARKQIESKTGKRAVSRYPAPVRFRSDGAGLRNFKIAQEPRKVKGK